MLRSILAASFLLIATTSCFNRRLHSTVLEPLVVIGDSQNKYRASAPMYWDIVHTRVALGFNLTAKTAHGQAWITTHPYMYATDSMELDAKGMAIQSVYLEGDKRTALQYTYLDDVLKIKLDKTYKTEDTIQISVRYTAMPYATDAGGSKAISEDRGLYFINTDNALPAKPVQIWTQGETEANSHWMPTFDKPNERFTLQVELTVPDSFTTLGNGHLLMQERAAPGMRRDIWSMDKPVQPYVAMFAIGKYAVAEEQWRGREVNYYVEPEYAPYAKLMFKNTPEMMEYFSTVTGVTYPWNKYSQVVVRDYVSGAMENTTATIFGEFMNQDAREIADFDHEDVVSHELFHQWFGDYVTAESWSNLTVNESFANYGEQLWRRHKYGDASADILAYKDLNAYLSSAAQTEPSLVRYHYGTQEAMFDLISYQKGGAILNYLHHLAGDQAFSRAMKIYLTKNALQPAEATHWRLAVEEATGKDWNWFFDQWYYRGGFPELDIEYNYDDVGKILQVNVSQQQERLFELPLRAEVIYGTEVLQEDWTLSDRKTVLTYPYKNGVRPVFVPDAGHWLVGKIKEDKSPQQWLTQYAGSPGNFLNRYTALSAVNEKLQDSSARAVFSLALADKQEEIRIHALNLLALNKVEKWKDRWKADIAFMAVNDVSNRVKAAAFDVLTAWKVQSSRQDMRDALSSSSYEVAGAALEGLRILKADSVYQLAKQILDNGARARLLASALDIVAENGKEDDYGIFSARAPYVYGNNRIQFAVNLGRYLENVHDPAVFEKAVITYVQMVGSESIPGYRAALVTFLFRTAGVYKNRVREARKNAEQEDAKKKLDLLKLYLSEIVTKEKDQNTKARYQAAMKKLFG